MIIKVKVYPSSGKEEIVKINEKEYKVYLKKPPEDNKANIELIKILKKYFLKNIRIIKGLRSRNKIIEVMD
jgi:uncharacterized protein (TIGR00251 family)